MATFLFYPTESWWQRLPLKFGRILASYPETLPMSLSRNSDGGIGEAAFLAAASLDAAKLEERKVDMVSKRGMVDPNRFIQPGSVTNKQLRFM